MQHTQIRTVLFLGLATFFPLFYYLAIAAGFLPYWAMLLIELRNITDIPFLWFSLIHLVIYGVVLFWMSGFIAGIILKYAAGHAWRFTLVVLLLLAGIGLLPIYGVAHGQIQWTNAYTVYFSNKLR